MGMELRSGRRVAKRGASELCEETSDVERPNRSEQPEVEQVRAEANRSQTELVSVQDELRKTKENLKEVSPNYICCLFRQSAADLMPCQIIKRCTRLESYPLAIQQALETIVRCRAIIRQQNSKVEKDNATIAEGKWPDGMLQPFAQGIKQQLKALAKHDKKSPYRKSLKALSEYSSPIWVQSRLEACPGLVEFFLAILPLSGVDVTEREQHRRRRCLVSALDAVMKGLDVSWLSPMGNLSAWVLHSVTQSELAIKILNGLGIGAPQTAPQKEAFKAVTAVLCSATPVIRGKTDVVMYGDNTQNGNCKTSRMRVDGESPGTCFARTLTQN